MFVLYHNNGHIYFIFTRNELMEILGCRENRVTHKIKTDYIIRSPKGLFYTAFKIYLLNAHLKKKL